jgi:HAMP domain-containing protein
LRRFHVKEDGSTGRISLEDPASRAGGSLELPGVPMVLGVSEPASGTPLLPLPFDPGLLEQDRFALGGDEWLAVRRVLAEPALQLVAAAPLNPFTEPFERTARAGALLLAGVALLGLILAHLLTGRLTRSLERLAGAAEAVAQGDLERRIEPAGTDEVGRVAAAFNAMTESLRRTLAELADRRALAAVGEFADALRTRQRASRLRCLDRLRRRAVPTRAFATPAWPGGAVRSRIRVAISSPASRGMSAPSRHPTCARSSPPRPT